MSVLAVTRREAWSFAVVHLAFALLLNFPVLTGKVPIPVHSINGFPPWTHVPDAIVPADDVNGTFDLITQIYPWRVMVAESLGRGELPLWNPHILGGTPLLANAQSATFYPLNWIFLILPAALAWTLLYVLQTSLSGFFTSLFVRNLGAGFVPALSSGFVFTASAFMTGWRGYPMGDAAMWLPLACCMVLLLAERQTPSAVVASAMVFSMPGLAGHPATALHIAITVAAFATWVLFEVERTRRTSYVLSVITAAVMALGLAAVQLIPIVEWLDHISRFDFWPPRPAFHAIALLIRQPVLDLEGVGYRTAEGAAYAGIGGLLLFGGALVGRHRRSAIFFVIAGIAAGGVVYGLNPFYWLSDVSPVVHGLKNRRLLLVVDFAIAVLLGLGASTVAERRKGRWGVAIITCFSAAALALGLLLVGALLEDVPFLKSREFTALLLGLTLGSVLLRVTGKWGQGAFHAALITLVVADLVPFSAGFVPYVPARSIYPPAPIMNYLKTTVDPAERIASVDAALPANVEMSYGLHALSGYDVALYNPQTLFADFLESPATGVAFNSSRLAAVRDRRLDMMAVRYLIVSHESGAERLRALPDRFVEVHFEDGMHVFENRKAIRPAVVVSLSNVDILPSRSLQVRRLTDPLFDPATSAFVSRPMQWPAEGVAAATPSNVGEVVRLSAGRVRVLVDIAEPSLLVLSESAYPGWRAVVDGTPRPVLTVNLLQMGVVLGPGAKEVLFEFRPPVVYASAAVSVLTLSLCVGLLWFHFLPVKVLPIVAIVTVGLLAAASTTIKWRVQADDVELELSRKEVGPGDFYVLRMTPPIPNVTVRYSLNGAAPQEFTVLLDLQGEIRFNIDDRTPKGTYRFIEFRPPGATQWSQAQATLVVK